MRASYYAMTDIASRLRGFFKLKVFYNFVLTAWALIRVFVTPVRGQTYMNQPHAAATFRTARASNDTWWDKAHHFFLHEVENRRNPQRANNLPFLCCCPMTPVDNSRSDAALHIGSNATAPRTTQSAA